MPLHIGEEELKSVNPTAYKVITNILDENEDLKIELAKLDHKYDDDKKIKDDKKKRKSHETKKGRQVTQV